MGNTHPGLGAFWHPVARLGEVPLEVELLGRSVVVAEAPFVAEHLGLVWVALEQPRFALPSVPEDEDSTYVRVPSAPWTWQAGAAQMADNFLDLGHLPFVHGGSFANPDDVEIPQLDVTRTPGGFEVVHHHTTMRLHGPGVGRRVMRLWFHAPHHVVLRLEYLDDDAVITTAFLHQPMDAQRTCLWAINWRNDILDGRCTPQDTTSFQELVGGEDKAMLERFVSKEVPLDQRTEIHTRADRPTLEMRRVLAELLAELLA